MSGTRRFVAFLVGNWASRTYLAAVIAAALYLAVGTAAHRGPDASFAGVPLIILTVPWSCLAFPLIDLGPGWLNPVVGGVAAVAGALANAAAISWLVRLVKRR